MKNFDKILVSFLLILAATFFTQANSSATVYTILIFIDGTQEVPANTSTAVGLMTGTYDDSTRILDIRLAFTGLGSPTIAAHLHAPAPEGVNAPIVTPFAGFPTGVFSGTYDTVVTLDSIQNVWILGGLYYVNIHTTLFPGGEIRGQLVEGTLPVELASFTSNVLKGTVSLNWSTAQEINNSGFDIERKLTSSNDWSKVGNVLGNGTTPQVRNYTFSESVPTGSYSYRLKQIDYNGNFEYFNLANEVIVGLPSSYNMSQNYPNPFNPTTKIDYELPYDSKVSIILYDISGREVANLVNDVKTAGYHTVQLNASSLSTGAYFYRISAQSGNQNFTLTKNLMVIK